MAHPPRAHNAPAVRGIASEVHDSSASVPRQPNGTVLRTDLPARLDRLPWSAWHWRVVTALGVTWVLDGLEVTLVGALSGVLGEPSTLHLNESQIGIAGSAYLAGAVLGALVFGRLTDLLGRKKLFLVTVAVYLAATLCTGLSIGWRTFALFRAITGAGIGGEYAAINSAIDELLPARVRGRADLAINGTYWLGTALGAASTLVLLDPRVVPHALGWRLAFVLGAALGLVVLFTRRHLPESPRWLLMHGRVPEAEAIVSDIESQVAARHGPLPAPHGTTDVTVHGAVGFRDVVRVILHTHRRRAVLGVVLMASQAFAYNAVFFTYALVLGRFYHVPGDRVGLYILPFALGNLLGPLVLGRLFDTVGRRTMIPLTYGLTAALLAWIAYAFGHGMLSLGAQTFWWCATFFVASAAASSAYLTVSELFPVQLRGMAIAIFFAAGTASGGVLGPVLFGALVQSGSRARVAAGYLFGAAVMAVAAGVALALGVSAEGRSLEKLAEMPDVREPAREA